MFQLFFLIWFFLLHISSHQGRILNRSHPRKLYKRQLGDNCETKQQEVETFERRPIVTCVHKNITQCHYSFTTKYLPTKQQEGLIWRLNVSCLEWTWIKRGFLPLKGSKQSDFKYLESLRLIDFSYVRWGKSYSGPYRENLLRIWAQGRCAAWCGLDYRNIKCTRGMSWSMRHASPAELRMRIRGLIIIYWHEFFQNIGLFPKTCPLFHFFE